MALFSLANVSSYVPSCSVFHQFSVSDPPKEVTLHLVTLPMFGLSTLVRGGPVPRTLRHLTLDQGAHPPTPSRPHRPSRTSSPYGLFSRLPDPRRPRPRRPKRRREDPQSRVQRLRSDPTKVPLPILLLYVLVQNDSFFSLQVSLPTDEPNVCSSEPLPSYSRLECPCLGENPTGLRRFGVGRYLSSSE